MLVGGINQKGDWGGRDPLVRRLKICILASWDHALERSPHRFRLHSGPDRNAGHGPGQSTEWGSERR
jgi:hypothetical protein